jgi:hypothetical protein
VVGGDKDGAESERGFFFVFQYDNAMKIMCLQVITFITSQYKDVSLQLSPSRSK